MAHGSQRQRTRSNLRKMRAFSPQRQGGFHRKTDFHQSVRAEGHRSRTALHANDNPRSCLLSRLRKTLAHIRKENAPERTRPRTRKRTRPFLPLPRPPAVPRAANRNPRRNARHAIAGYAIYGNAIPKRAERRVECEFERLKWIELATVF